MDGNAIEIAAAQWLSSGEALENSSGNRTVPTALASSSCAITFWVTTGHEGFADRSRKAKAFESQPVLGQCIGLAQFRG
jgi:hypothetical protein